MEPSKTIKQFDGYAPTTTPARPREDEEGEEDSYLVRKILDIVSNPLSETIDLQRSPDTPLVGGSIMTSRFDNTTGGKRAEPPIDKHDRHRKRNREAAQKCRIRKKRCTQKLVTDAAAVEVANSSLRKEVACLRREIFFLKDLVLQHADCDCSYVQTYVKLAASKLAAEMADGGIGEQPCRCAPLSRPWSQQRVSKAVNNTVAAQGLAATP